MHISPIWASQVAQWVKNPPAMQEMLVQSQCPQDPLEEGMATHFSVLAWRIPWTEGMAALCSITKSQAVWETDNKQYEVKWVPC